MSEDTVTEVGRSPLAGGIELVKKRHQGMYHGRVNGTYDFMRTELEGLDDNGIVALSQIATALKNLPGSDVIGVNAEEVLRDYARDIAEDEEVPFQYEDYDGKVNTYTPAALWESSSSCEWETSAEEGYDYGWNI